MQAPTLSIGFELFKLLDSKSGDALQLVGIFVLLLLAVFTKNPRSRPQDNGALIVAIFTTVLGATMGIVDGITDKTIRTVLLEMIGQ